MCRNITTLRGLEPDATPEEADADEALTAEQREAAAHAEPHTVTVGPAGERDRTVERVD